MAQINKPSEYFNTKLYTGNNTSTSITGVGFQPDLIWFKRRDSSAQHSLFDSVRGVTKRLASNLTNAENTITDALTSFDSDGFTLGVDSSNYINFNTATYASWNWKANGAGVSNTDGSITSTVSASTTSGFSIVSYTGTGSNATVGHGLGVAPAMVIVKERSGVDAWIVGHSSIGFTKNLLLNATNVEFADSTIWNNTAPTSSFFSVGSSASTNESSATYIAYCFAEKKSFSKFGLYSGNSNVDGTFVYTGFKPAFVLIKGKGALENWRIFDNKRIGYNPANYILYPSGDFAEDTTGSNIDFLSNGFKLRETNAGTNGSGQGYIYMAFASEPLTGTNGVPTTAR
jgi:hypothetical protein